MHCWTIIAAGGQGARLATNDAAAADGLSRPKQFLPVAGSPLYWRSALPFARIPRIRGLVFVFPSAHLDDARKELENLLRRDAPGLDWRAVAGGESRQDSVANGIAALPKACDTVLIHDAARPFVGPVLINRILDALALGHAGVIPGIALADTVKQIGHANMVAATPPRQALRAVQTPQGFALPTLRRAHKLAALHGFAATDDAALLERYGHPVLVVDGDEMNRKITTPADLALLRNDAALDKPMNTLSPVVGFGYDVHRYGGSRPFVLGGVRIPTDITVSAHSDGDVLLHALADALLGCLGRGDIGGLFPDSATEFDGISSAVLLAEVMRLAVRQSLTLTHADLTVVAQAPKIAPFREQIAKNIASLLQLPLASVNVKATTEEHLGFTGEKLGIKAYAVVTGLKGP